MQMHRGFSFSCARADGDGSHWILRSQAQGSDAENVQDPGEACVRHRRGGLRWGSVQFTRAGLLRGNRLRSDDIPFANGP